MCGIAGFIGHPAGDGMVHLRALAHALEHRGPDGEGFLLRAFGDHEQVGFAHRRLAIIDLKTGQQPVSNERGTIHVVFNGEIYNYRALRAELTRAGHQFRTDSDTETIVHAYEEFGDDFVDHLRGMFAFALWDGERSRLVLARDRFGEKPLFIAEAENALVFASEIKAILKWPGIGPRLDHAMLPVFLQYRYVPGPATLIRGVRKLPPGCLAVWEDGALTERRYYMPPDGRERRQVPHIAEPAKDFALLLDESVALMMVSDVPFGAFLSGGLDSSAIVALMSRHSSRPVRTYSVGFEEAGFSELAYAAQVARAFGTEHHELVLAQDRIIDLLPNAAALRDAPLTEPADLALYLLACEARNTVKMVLTGEGSDESLGGYPKHAFEAGSAKLALPDFVRRRLIGPTADALPYPARRMRTALRALAESDFRRRMPLWFGALSVDEVGELLGDAPAPALNGQAFPFESSDDVSALRRILYFDQTSWLPDNLLERGDRMTMAASIEARMPFLDHRLVEMVSSLPDEFRVRGSTAKRILRTAMAAMLPASIVNRRKVGFRMPVHLWFADRLRPLLHEVLEGSGSTIVGALDRSVVSRVLGEHVQGKRNHEKLLWMLLALELWCRANRVSV
jgi:asparagine synthase (glutamine-hydrolysing)